MNTHTINNRFPVVAAAALAIVVALGFARTYYLRVLFDLPPMTRALHTHGIVATLWLALHYTQARLIAAHRVDWHRRLGMAGALIGAWMIAQSFELSVLGAAHGRAPPGRDPIAFLSVTLGATLMFTTFFVAGLAARRQRDWHKRFMFLATCALLIPAVGRLDRVFLAQFGVPMLVVPSLVTFGFVAWACWNDWRKRGQVHPAYWIGGGLLLVSLPLRRTLGYAEFWPGFAQSLIGWMT
jgi:hypothetical protein